MGRKFKLSIGFTLIELVMVMVILSILSVTVAPKFFDNSVFQARGFADQVLATLRYAQKTAIAQHRHVCVSLTTMDVTLTIDAAQIAPINAVCDGNLNLPDRVSNTLNAPTGITFDPPTPTSLSFNALGRATANAEIKISTVDAPIFVEAETGYVYQ